MPRPRASTPREKALAECAAGAQALRAGRTEAGFRRYAAAIALAPQDADVAAVHGVALRSAGRMQDAQRELIRAISLDTTRADSYTQLAQTFILVKDHAQAANAFLAAATLQITNAVAWRDAAEAMRLAHRIDDGVQLGRHAFALDDRDPSIANTLALLLHRSGDIDAALALCARTRAQAPDDRNLSLTHAMLLRTCEQYAEGWALHERRLELPELTQRPCPPASPRWDGAPLDGRHIVVRGEQGLGDQVQFARWAAALRTCGASRITVLCAPPLVRLLQTLDGVDAVVPSDQPAPTHDVHVDVMSLPHLLRTGNDMQRAMVPYLRAPVVNRTLATRLQDAARNGRLRLGLVWGGTPAHTEDRSRSMPLAALLPVLLQPDLQVVVLQQGSSREQLDTVPPDQRAQLVDVAPDCLDMADTAQVLASCDVLLSVDTSVAHVAGALGVPTWVMVAHPAEWRWGRDRTDCLFYPNTIVLRQHAGGDWSAVISAVQALLDAWRHAQR
ncbi:MAG: glycosyltransferase family 9 protein [Gemmatimonadota bacterium]